MRATRPQTEYETDFHGSCVLRAVWSALNGVRQKMLAERGPSDGRRRADGVAIDVPRLPECSRPRAPPSSAGVRHLYFAPCLLPPGPGSWRIEGPRASWWTHTCLRTGSRPHSRWPTSLGSSDPWHTTPSPVSRAGGCSARCVCRRVPARAPSCRSRVCLTRVLSFPGPGRADERLHALHVPSRGRTHL